MLIGKRIKRILIIISSLILIIIIYYSYQRNRKIEVYQIYQEDIGYFYRLEYAVKNFHFGKNQFKQLDIIAKRILLDSLRNGYIKNGHSGVLITFTNGAYFTLTPEYKGLDFTVDWYDAATYNLIAFYEWNLKTGKNINKKYYQEVLFWANDIFLSVTDTTLDIDKSLLPY